jgi:AraC-like DNA-binding protein
MKKRQAPGISDNLLPPKEESAILYELTPYVRRCTDDTRDDWHVAPKRLLDYLLIYIAGDCYIQIKDEKQMLIGESLIWIPPNTLYELHSSSKIRCMYIYFDLIYNPNRSHWDAYLPGDPRDLTYFDGLMHPPVNNTLINELIGKMEIEEFFLVKNIMNQMCKNYQKNLQKSILALSGMLLQLIDEIIKNRFNEAEPRTIHKQLLNDAANYILKHIDENVDVTETANNFGFSATHFRKLFREAYGISPQAYHRYHRMRRSSELLSYTNLKISEIANSLGFSNVHNFSRAFKKVHFISPTEYRKGIIN